jgi:hypothetical protein
MPRKESSSEKSALLSSEERGAVWKIYYDDGRNTALWRFIYWDRIDQGW